MPSPGSVWLIAALALSATGVDPSLPGKAHSTPTGTVWVEMASAGAGKPREGIGRGVIEAPPERVWRALADYAHWNEFMPFLEKSTAQAQPDGSVLSDHALHFPSPIGERRYRVRLTRSIAEDKAGRVWHIRWTYVAGSGNIADHRGSWQLTALAPNRTLAVCRLYTDPGGSTPRWALDRGTVRMLPWIFDGLRQHVRRARYDRP